MPAEANVHVALSEVLRERREERRREQEWIQRAVKGSVHVPVSLDRVEAGLGDEPQ